MIDNLEILNDTDVAARVHELKDQGYRFVTMTGCTNDDGTVDIFIHLTRIANFVH